MVHPEEPPFFAISLPGGDSYLPYVLAAPMPSNRNSINVSWDRQRPHLHCPFPSPLQSPCASGSLEATGTKYKSSLQVNNICLLNLLFSLTWSYGGKRFHWVLSQCGVNLCNLLFQELIQAGSWNTVRLCYPEFSRNEFSSQLSFPGAGMLTTFHC